MQFDLNGLPDHLVHVSGFGYDPEVLELDAMARLTLCSATAELSGCSTCYLLSHSTGSHMDITLHLVNCMPVVFCSASGS
jgi:hypothetical protein